MASRHLVRVANNSFKLPQRFICTSSVCRTDIQLDAQSKERIYPKIGNRDVVGYGLNGASSYLDLTDFPCPGIRFKENTPDILALREKEKGEWKKLTLQEKKELYRASFCQTYSEMNAPKGEWKSITISMILCIVATGWLCIWMKFYVYPSFPKTINREWQEAEVRRMIDLRTGAVEGIGSKWDYEKGQWK